MVPARWAPARQCMRTDLAFASCASTSASRFSRKSSSGPHPGWLAKRSAMCLRGGIVDHAWLNGVLLRAGGIDLQVLGVGTDGHIGFNEPTSSLGSITRVKTLTQQTIEDNSRFFEPDEFQPKLAITMGIKTILDARRILILANGENKAQAVRDMVEGPLSAFCPASALQLHQRTTVLIDEPAASKLTLKGYYKFVGEMQDDLLRKHRPSDWISR